MIHLPFFLSSRSPRILRGMLPYPAIYEDAHHRRSPPARLLAARAGTAQMRAIQVGYCTRLASLEAAKAAGFDYVELATSEIAGLSDAEFEQAAARIRQVGLPVPAMNLFLPATLKVTGPDINRDEQMAYVKKAFARLERIGTTIVVFGSGGARQVPAGFSKDEALRQLVEFGRRIAPEARARGITIAVEPLRTEETNIINSAAEGLALVEAIGDPNFQLMVDFYHLASVKEDPSIIVRARDHIRHLHMANPEGRVFPARRRRVRLRAVLRGAANNRVRQAHQRRSVDKGFRGRRATGDRTAPQGNSVAAAACCTARLALLFIRRLHGLHRLERVAAAKRLYRT